MSFINKLKNTIIDAKEKARNSIEFIDITESDKRIAICLECPHLSHTLMQCEKCGCFMKAKTKLKSASCPINKW